jgi:hypothetical protein
MQQAAPIASRTGPVGPASFVEWGAVLAGAGLAAGLSFVLLTFGAAIGLSATSPWPTSGLSVKVIATLAVFWALAQQIGSLMGGGYVAGRMRSRWHEAGDETEFRDGLHGGLVWAVAVLISAFFVFATASLAVRTGADVAGSAVAGAASRTTKCSRLGCLRDRRGRRAGGHPVQPRRRRLLRRRHRASGNQR